MQWEEEISLSLATFGKTMRTLLHHSSVYPYTVDQQYCLFLVQVLGL